MGIYIPEDDDDYFAALVKQGREALARGESFTQEHMRDTLAKYLKEWLPEGEEWT